MKYSNSKHCLGFTASWIIHTAEVCGWSSNNRFLKQKKYLLQLQRKILFLQLNTRMKIQKQDENIGMFNILFQTTDMI